jgi:hypothetical protein
MLHGGKISDVLIVFSVGRGRLIETFFALVREVTSFFFLCSIDPVDLGHQQ